MRKSVRRLENSGMWGEFEKNGEGTFLRSLAKDYSGRAITVFDVGANVGDWSRLLEKEIEANKGFLTLHVFEPVADYQGPGVFNKAVVSDVAGIVSMHVWGGIGDNNSLYERRLFQRKSGKPQVVEVPAVRLDEYITKNNIGHIDLLKVDVEGHDLAVLRSAGKYLDPSYISYIQFEYGNAYVESKSYLLDAYQLLEGRGYRICKILPKHLELTPYDGMLEDFNVANYVALK